jgi:acetylornithine/succinyldiaminopimelate/putrescine aminotransferase
VFNDLIGMGKKGKQPGSSSGLLSWTEARSLPWREVERCYGRHLNPGMLTTLRRLGYHRKRLVSARGVYVEDSDGRRILDCWAGFGTLGLGHNHPRLTEVRRSFDDADLVEIAHAFIPVHATVLARNLAALLPGDLEVSYLCCTGSEAVEAALKLVQKYHPRRGKIVYATGSMHGLTHGALSVTGYQPYRNPFKTLSGCVPVPYGDSRAMRDVLGAMGRDVMAVILEPIQCGAGVVIPPDGYLGDVAGMCRDTGALLVMDEVQTGLGRTGRMFAFEHEGIIPDVVLLSKSLGGGKAPVAACVSRGEVFERAYGDPRDSSLHTSTFSGMGGGCALATEVLGAIVEEGLVDNAARVGRHLLDGLGALARKHGALVTEVRGRGLLVGVELRDPTGLVPGELKRRLPGIHKLGEGALAALVAVSLLFEHDILVAFTEYRRNVLRLEPPLILTMEQADSVVAALDEVLSGGLTGLVAAAVRARTPAGR